MKGIKYVNLILFVFNCTDYRTDYDKKELLMMSEMFNEDFIKNSAFVFTHMKFDEDSIEERIKEGLTHEFYRD